MLCESLHSTKIPHQWVGGVSGNLKAKCYKHNIKSSAKVLWMPFVMLVIGTSSSGTPGR